MTRKKIPAALKRLIYERDQSSCRKCGRRNSLDVHHIIRLSDGGTDELDNLTLLCMLCHWEWHTITMIKLHPPFEEWAGMPPINMILHWLMDNNPEHLHMPFIEARQELFDNYQVIRDAVRRGDFDDIEEDEEEFED